MAKDITVFKMDDGKDEGVEDTAHKLKRVNINKMN